MVSTAIVDMMAHWVAKKVSTENVDAQVTVVGLEFWNELEKAKNRTYYSSSPSPRFLNKLEQTLRSENRRLVFPVFLAKEKHFIAMQVCCKENTIVSGKSTHLHHLKKQRLNQTCR
ncbi:hypothetical protein HETIRDRAFT_145630 [Heterobasidion irregulare TC 32-1]|uniref:Ubiquitin-like protease family profile domain-containing protein n=1 Tax=Heterobasidion irregulare (strain TC 32-1) TaxID=747525 RepID=W4KPM0_HETIT|nr:uncharacterized protein HETIRDRAFT_145630 [Heterobasidion irregulare TC 32-1]ETW87762.1 hypothetical protein HETIRDRAFT_145630 [Heterobasidion irregulare TC 32-1]